MDNNETYEKAIELYKGGIKSLINAIKYEQTLSVREKETIKNKCREFLNRAEFLKHKIENNQEKSNIDNTRVKTPDELKSVVWCKPSVKFDDIIGLEEVIARLKEGIILPAKYPALFTSKGFGHRKYLLFGPPGTGKTLMAKALGMETGCKCLFLSAAKLLPPYQDSERLIKTLFIHAREIKPVLVFIDEIDALFPHPDCEISERIRRIRTELLVQMEGIGQSNAEIQIFAATNCPLAIPPAVRKNFSHRLYFPLPDQQERCRMTEKCLKDNQVYHCLDKEDINVIGEKTEGYTCFDISHLIQYASVQLSCEAYESMFFRKITFEENQDQQIVSKPQNITRYDIPNRLVVGTESVDVGTNKTHENTDGVVIQKCQKTEGNVNKSLRDPDTISIDETTAMAKEKNNLDPPMGKEDHLKWCIREQSKDKINQQLEQNVASSIPAQNDLDKTNPLSLGSTLHLGYCYTPCSPDTEGALKLNQSDIRDNTILPPPLSLDCVLNLLTKVKATVDQRNIDDNLQFKKDFVDL